MKSNSELDWGTRSGPKKWEGSTAITCTDLLWKYEAGGKQTFEEDSFECCVQRIMTSLYSTFLSLD